MKWFHPVYLGAAVALMLSLAACVPADKEYGLCTDLGWCPDDCSSDSDNSDCNTSEPASSVHHEPGSPPIQDDSQ